jgi:hypothetical protein
MKRVAIAAVLLLVPISSWGGLIPVLDITAGGTTAVPLADAVGGWSFHIASPLTISALGLWDEGGRPLSIDHQIGLWTITQALLVSAIVTNASTPVASASPNGRWLFTPIDPIQLQPGDYVLGAVWGDPIIGADPFRQGTVSQTSFGAEFTGARIATLLPAPVLVFPFGTIASSGDGLFGPNLAVNTPEPGAGFLALSGLVACLGIRRPRCDRVEPPSAPSPRRQ